MPPLLTKARYTVLSTQSKKKTLTLFEIAIFAMLGSMMFASKLLTDLLPNIHLLGMFTILFTVVFRYKALIPIYVFVALMGIYAGFAAWWIPYLYLWTVLWAMAMLIPRNLPKGWQYIVYPAVCGLHGFAYGTLYAPAQVLLYGMGFEQLPAWILAGLPWDAVHGIGNIATGFLVAPLVPLLQKLLKNAHK